jgi:hypothetical protein
MDVHRSAAHDREARIERGRSLGVDHATIGQYFHISNGKAAAQAIDEVRVVPICDDAWPRFRGHRPVATD